MGSPVVDKAYECLRFARAAATDEQRVAWDNLAQLWINLANERCLMTPCEQEIETQRLRELEALAVERHGRSKPATPVRASHLAFGSQLGADAAACH